MSTESLLRMERSLERPYPNPRRCVVNHHSRIALGQKERIESLNLLADSPELVNELAKRLHRQVHLVHEIVYLSDDRQDVGRGALSFLGADPGLAQRPQGRQERKEGVVNLVSYINDEAFGRVERARHIDDACAPLRLQVEALYPGYFLQNIVRERVDVGLEPVHTIQNASKVSDKAENLI